MADEWRPFKLQYYWKRPEYWEESWRLEETCCHSNSSEKPSAKTDVKNSQGVNNNNNNLFFFLGGGFIFSVSSLCQTYSIYHLTFFFCSLSFWPFFFFFVPPSIFQLWQPGFLLIITSEHYFWLASEIWSNTHLFFLFNLTDEHLAYSWNSTLDTFYWVSLLLRLSLCE